MDKVADTVDKALDLLKALAEKLGTTIERLYPYFVRQVYVEAWIGLLAGLLACGGVAGGGIYLYRFSRRMKAIEPDKEWGSGMFFGGLAIVASVVVFGIILAGNLPGVLNPEYDAIRRIINTATGR